MYMKKALVLILILALSLTTFGCKAIDVMKNLVSEDEDVEILRSDEFDMDTADDLNLRDTVLYYQNENGYLVPVRRQIPWEEGIAKAALSNMVDSPALREDIGIIGLLPVIPAGTEIKGMSINEETGLCKVDFTEEVLSYNSKTEEENLVRGVVYTLTEFPAISQVQLMVEGSLVSELKYGTMVAGPINREDINALETADMGEAKVVVYYKGTSNGEYEYYVPLTVPTLAPAPNVLTALEKLFHGAPEDTGLYTDIPSDIELLGVEISDGIAYIDLSQEAKSSLEDPIGYEKLSKNIGLTLSQFPEIDMVEMLIDGETLEEAGINVVDPNLMPVFANEY